MNVSVTSQKIFDKSKKGETAGKRQPLGSELFKLEFNRSVNTWLQDNSKNLNKTSGPDFWKKYQRFIVDRNKTSGALKNHEGKHVSSAEE